MFKRTDPKILWDRFSKIFPKEAEDSYKFKSNNKRKNSIIIFFKNKRPLLFSSESDKKWSLQPYDD